MRVTITVDTDVPGDLTQAVEVLQRLGNGKLAGNGKTSATVAEVCPTHGAAKTKPSSKIPGGFYCAARNGAVYCKWSYEPEA